MPSVGNEFVYDYIVLSHPVMIQEIMRKTRKKYCQLIGFLILLILVLCCGIVYVGFFRYKGTDDVDPKIDDKKRISIYENMIDALRETRSTGYQKRPETKHVDCGKVVAGDKQYIKSLTGKRRIPLIENRRVNMSCAAIQDRIRPRNRVFKRLPEGISFARIVYKDYEFIEKQIEMSYHPQNTFCFAVDKKSSEQFIARMKKLHECLSNVIVLPVTDLYDSSGHNMNRAHHRCMKSLIPISGWNYVLLLQNHDVIIKSVYELASIYKLLGGANDIHYGKEVDERRVPGLRWDPRSIKLFPNETGISENVLNTPMRVSSGSVQASLSRAAAEWLVMEVDLTTAIAQFDQTAYGSDEQLFPSLQLNHEYGMPGHFTDICSHYKGPKQTTRFVQWASGDINNCPTKSDRHGVCLIGIEQLGAISRMPFIMVNKMMPAFDYSIIECTAELLFNRTFLGQKDRELDEKFYKELIHVKYHKQEKGPRIELDCNSNQKPWKYEDYL